jgi:ankyrin repeat protein
MYNHIFQNTAFLLSAKRGNREMVEYLLDRRDIFELNIDTALLESAQYGQLNIVELLLNCGANIHFNDDNSLLLSVRFRQCTANDFNNYKMKVINDMGM